MKKTLFLLLEAMACGIGFGLLAVSIVLLWNALYRSQPDAWYAVFLIVIGLICFAVGALFWHYLVNPNQRDPERSWILGACAGGLTAVVAHFAVGFIFFPTVLILDKMINGTSGGYGPMVTIVGCAGMVIDYFVRFFWLELPAGAAAGALFARCAQAASKRVWRNAT